MDLDFELLLSAVHAYLGRNHALLAMAQTDDLSAEAEPVNEPNSCTYPNWSRRLGRSLAELAKQRTLTTVATALQGGTGKYGAAAAMACGRQS